jgi:hypothetical protein
MFPSSAPCPLCPRFRPVMWNLEVMGTVDPDSCCSPNFEKNPLRFGLLCSSFSPTSSNPSSAVGGSLSKRRSPIAERGNRGNRGNRAESRLWRALSAATIGDLADMSCSCYS